MAVENIGTESGIVTINMPESYNERSKEFIAKTLVSLPFYMRDKVAKRYSEKYQEAYESESVNFKKDNRAGFVANTWIREFTQKYNKIESGVVSKPPIAKETLALLGLTAEIRA